MGGMMTLCFAMGSPDWWTDYREFDCEREEGHEGPHRMTIEWEDQPSLELGSMDGWNDPT